MMTFLITLLIIFFLFRLVVPHLLRWALKAFLKKTIRNGTFVDGTFMGGNGKSNHGPFNAADPAPEGQIKVDYVPDNKKQAKPTEFRGGEYVEYEEVK